MLGRVPVGERLSRADLGHREARQGRAFELEDIFKELEDAQFTALDSRRRHLRVVVHENPYARIRVPSELYAISRGGNTMKSDNQDEVCEFVREIVSVRTREPIALTERPDRERRNIKAVEELWASSNQRYAVEHTLIESFEGQLANLAKIERLLVPVKDMLAGRLPGRFALAVRETETSAARVNFAVAHQEVARLVLEAVDGLKVGETVTLGSKALPFELRLHLRFKEDSRLILYTDIEGDLEELRLERVRRALDAKCPKLATWARDGRTSVLIFEADDIQHSNSSVVYSAVAPALAERNDQPDIVVLVETDGSPWNGWILKEGDRLGDDVPRNRDGGYLYERGRVR